MPIQPRQQLTSLHNKYYFNYGGQGPLPESALQAIVQSYHQLQSLGPYSHRRNDWVAQECHHTRATIAAELQVPTSTITLTENVSTGCNIALWGIPWQAGDHLLLTDGEHASVMAAAQEIARRFEVKVSTCSVVETLNHGDPIEAIASQVSDRTQLVVISHILWSTGQILPQQEIAIACRSQNPQVKILVDAAQSVGLLPLNLTADAIDFYAFTGHKWWCGPAGLGGLYVRPETLETLHPTFIGWRGIQETSQGQPSGWKPGARRYEVATSAYPLLAGLRQAIAFHHLSGTAQHRNHLIRQNSLLLWQKLTELPQIHCLHQNPPHAGLVSFRLQNRQHEQLVHTLEDQNIMVRTIPDLQCIRACVHYFTQPEEIDQLVNAIRNFP